MTYSIPKEWWPYLKLVNIRLPWHVSRANTPKEIVKEIEELDEWIFRMGYRHDFIIDEDEDGKES